MIPAEPLSREENSSKTFLGRTHIKRVIGKEKL